MSTIANHVMQPTAAEIRTVLGARPQVPTHKQAEFILGMDKMKALEILPSHDGRITGLPLAEFCERAYPHLQLRPRQTFENDTTLIHFIPYIGVIDIDTGRRLFYKRPDKKNGEQKLSGKYSIGLGGHPEIADLIFEQGRLDLLSSLMACAIREGNEELVMTSKTGQLYTSNLDVPGLRMSFDSFILDWDPVGLVHLGIHMNIWLNASEVTVRAGDDQAEYMRWQEEGEDLTSFDMEGWSRIILTQGK